jgi:hypothetical protein
MHPFVCIGYMYRYNILVNLEILNKFKYPALVLHYSEEGVLLLLRFCVIIFYCALN